jgi:Immunoglobulin domain
MGKVCRSVMYRLQKIAICLVFIGFFAAEGHAQLGGPPAIVVQPLGLAVQNGGAAVLTATAVSITSMKFYWFLNDQPVSKANANIVNVVVPLVGTVSTLTVSNISSANAGNYSLRITNAVGSAVSSNATVLVLTSTVTNVVNILSSGTGMTDSGFKIQLSGPAGSNYVIQASTDLKNWVPISTNLAPTGTVSYTDATAKNQPYRYYRAKIQ